MTLRPGCTQHLATPARTGAVPILRIGLCQPDLIGSRIYGEEKVAFMNDISILEIDADQRPADLGAELDLLNRGKLTNETQPRVTRQRLAHHDLREGRSRRRCRCVTRIAEPCRERSDGKRRTRADNQCAFVHLSAHHHR